MKLINCFELSDIPRRHSFLLGFSLISCDFRTWKCTMVGNVEDESFETGVYFRL